MKILLWSLVFLFWLTGCGSGFPGFRPLSYSNKSEARVYISPDLCMHSPVVQGKKEIAVIPAALAVQAVNVIFDKFNTALKNGTQAGNLPASISSLNFEPEKGRIPTCILIVRGEFVNGPETKDSKQLLDFILEPLTPAEMSIRASPKYVAAKKSRKLQRPEKFKDEAEEFEWKSMSELWQKEADLLEKSRRYSEFRIAKNSTWINSIDHIFELQMVIASNKKFLAIAPVFARVDRSLDDDKSGVRSFAISTKFEPAKESVTGTDSGAKAGSLVQLRNLRIGKAVVYSPVIDQRLRFSNESDWFGVFNGVSGDGGGASTSSDAVNSAGKSQGKYTVANDSFKGDNQKEVENLDFYLQSISTSSVPMTVTTTVVEARPDKVGRAFFAEVFDGTKDALKNSLTSKLQNNDQKKVADATEFGASMLALDSRLEAENQAVQKIREYCNVMTSSGDSVSERTDRVAKVSAANKSSIALMRLTSPPGQMIFGSLLENTDSSSNPSNVAVCKRLDSDQKW